MNNKTTSRGITIPNLKLYYGAIVIKKNGIGIKKFMEINENWTEDLGINSHIYKHLIFEKEFRNRHWKNTSSINGSSQTIWPHIEELE